MNKYKKFLILLLSGLLVFSCSVSAFAAKGYYTTATPDQWMPQKYTGFTYQHDPMQYEKAAKDIIVDPNSIYGYSPNPNSTRLGEYASYDWSNPSVVWKARQDRIKYQQEDMGMYQMLLSLKAEGKSI